MRRLAAFIVAFALLPAGSWASSKKAGTSGAQFLKIGAGARPTAMGDAFVGVADDVNSVYYNPAGVAFLDRPEMTAMHMQYFQGLDYDFGAFSHPTAKGAFAISAATLKTDDMTRRGNDEGSLGTFNNQDAAYALSYGHLLGEALSAGLTVRYIDQRIDSTSAQAWSGDVGVLKGFDTKRPVTVGFAIKHFGQKIEFSEQADPLPLTLDAGASMALLQNRLMVATDIRHVRDSGFQYGLGTEWRHQVGEKFRYAARGGYNTATTDAGGTTGISLGFGAGYGVFDLDFAWVPFGNLGNTFRYAAHLKF